MNSRITGDLPRTDISEDVYGLGKLVSAVRASIAEIPANSTFTIGIEGAWGSGKTTFSNFLKKELESDSGKFRVLSLNPWSIRPAPLYIGATLAMVASELERYERTVNPWYKFYGIRKFFRRTNSQRLRRYGELATSLANLSTGLSAFDPTGSSTIAAIGLKQVGVISRLFWNEGGTISELKHEVSSALLSLVNKPNSPRFIIFIDDTDRLEPNEALEVLRVVREVGNFPLLTYVVCFDRTVLAEQIDVTLGMDNGNEYIEKFLPHVISIPPFEARALRGHFQSLLNPTLDRYLETTGGIDSFEEYRFHLVMDEWAGLLLKTPRDVVRVHESVELGWLSMPEGYDFMDFIWLQMVRIKAPELFEFAKRYLSEVGNYRDSNAQKSPLGNPLSVELASILRNLGWDGALDVNYGLSYMLPGIRTSRSKDLEVELFRYSHDDIVSLERERRLGSPSHWRQYFSYSVPSYALPDEKINEFREAVVTDVDLAETKLLSLVVPSSRNPTHLVEALLNRLNDLPSAAISGAESIGILRVLSRTMDIVARSQSMEMPASSIGAWSSARKFVRRADASELSEVIAGAASIHWLASLLRYEGFAHGLPSPERADPGVQWLSAKQLDECVTLLIKRQKQMGPKKLLDGPAPHGILYLWFQLGQPNDVRETLADWCRDDEVFLGVLKALSGWRQSSAEGRSYPLEYSVVDMFFVAREAKARLTDLAAEDNPRSDLRSRAASLLAAWQDPESK